ncbi:MAG: sigma-70 family RNA polymerase sigma factor [Chloroflexi bacterium]|nr:sigma-70 family RNA polymerase sigma factor [Chloroflexota bacterium]
MAEEEEALIARSRGGDVNAFNLLVERYQRMVYSVVFRMLGHRQEAEDVTQEAFLSAFQGVARFRGGSFRAWLLRIAANACYDHLRFRRRRPTVSLDVLESESGNPLPGHIASPEEHVLRGELARLIEEGLGQLPEEQRLAVVLCDVQGFSYEEAAEATRSSLGTVKSRLSRGRARLRDFFKEHRELLPSLYRHRT